MQNRWLNYIKELSNIIFFYVFAIVFFFLFRLAFVIIYRAELLDNLAVSEFLKSFYMGFRFDSQIAAYFILIPFLITPICAYYNRIQIAVKTRKILQIIFVVSATIMCLVTLNYYREYNDQFNHFLFLALYDDMTAVFQTIITDFNPIVNLVSISIIISLGIVVLKHFETKTTLYKGLSRITKRPAKIILILLAVFLMVSCLRASFSTLPIRRYYASITLDPFLNKTIVNPFRQLTYAIEDFNSKNRIDSHNPFLPIGQIIDTLNTERISDVLRKKSQGPVISKPKQIFLVVMESFDAWPLMDRYQHLNLAPQLRAIQDKGLRFDNFLPASNSTMNSFVTVTTGIPYSGVSLGNIGATDPTYSTSIFKQFKALGYKVNFFTGGYLSWQNIGNFTTNQGADAIYGGPNTLKPCDFWGTSDENIFEFILETLDSEENSLNVILTTSYHPPYQMDIKAEGFPYASIEDFKDVAQDLYKDGMRHIELGHLWYSDKALGNFVKKAELQFPTALFAFTGDHFGRRFINSNPTLYEKSSVPFILYNSEIKPEINHRPGSHIDILPTLIELVAPKDFEYYSFGTSLFDSKEENLGIGFETIISNSAIELLSEDGTVQSFDLKSNKLKINRESTYKSDYNKLMGLGWHFVVKGDTLQHRQPKTDL